jgi:hypothetical protein
MAEVTSSSLVGSTPRIRTDKGETPRIGKDYSLPHLLSEQAKLPQQSALVVQKEFWGEQHVTPFSQDPVQHSSPAANRHLPQKPSPLQIPLQH